MKCKMDTSFLQLLIKKNSHSGYKMKKFFFYETKNCYFLFMNGETYKFKKK